MYKTQIIVILLFIYSCSTESPISPSIQYYPDDQTFIDNEPFLMAIDCENRLFSKFPPNADLKQVKNWENPINNKLIKKTIINSCSL